MDFAAERCHAVHLDCSEHDHVTVLSSRDVAELHVALLTSTDWRTIPSSPDLRLTRD